MPAKNEFHARFCRNMRRRREELGLTQKVLAERLGMQPAQVAIIETGVNCPTLETVNRVAGALDISPEALFLLDLTHV